MAENMEWSGEQYGCYLTHEIIQSFYHFIESLFDCCDDLETCFCGCCCPACLFGQNAENIDGSNCCLMCCAYAVLSPCYLCWIPHCMKREALRQKYGLKDDPNCSDCPAACCCGPCALCQEARLLKHRGMLNSYHCLIFIFLQVDNKI